MKLLRKIRAFFRKEKLDAEMAEEMRAHLELLTAENEKRGMSGEDARYAAQRAFGGVEQIKERARDQRARGWLWLEHLVRELRFSFRALCKARGFSLAVIATLALCIGANTAILSTLYALLLKPLPVREPGRLVEIHGVFPGAMRPDETVSISEYLAYRDRATLLESVCLWTEWAFTLGEDSEPQRLRGARVLADYFRVLGVAPLHGRFFTAENSTPENDKVVVLTQTLWEAQFQADPTIVGQTIKLSGELFTVVGIAPRHAEAIDARVRLFTPFQYRPPVRGLGAGGIMFARLKPGVTRASARAQIDRLGREVFAAAGSEWRAMLAAPGARFELSPIRARQVGAMKEALLALQGAGGLLLLLGAANVANLMLARATTQLPELALRQALGASRGALARRLLLDASLLGLAGTVLGVALAWAGLGVINHYAPQAVASSAPVALDGIVLAAASLVSLLIAAGIGAWPIWRLLAGPAAGDNMAALIQAGPTRVSARPSTRTASATLVTAQVALALILLTGSGLLLRSFAKIVALEPGLDAEQLFMARIAQPAAALRDNHQLWAFEQRIVEKLREIPGVERVSLTTTTLLDNEHMTGAELNAYKLPGQTPEPGPQTTINVFNVMPDFFATLGIRLLEGRDFTNADNARAPQVVIIDRALAERLFPGRSALGEKLSTRGTPAPGAEWPVVIGVVENARLRGREGPNAFPFAYNPAQQTGALRGAVTVVLRTSGSAPRDDLLAYVRARVREVDATLPVLYAGRIDARMDTLLTKRRGVLLLSGALGVLALVLSSVGLYGMLAYEVSRRTREFGIRGALGATRGQIVALVLRAGLSKTLAGLAIGLVGAGYLSRYLQSLLYDVKPFDPVAVAGVSLLLLTVATLASYLPARRAAKVDPMVALRAE